MIPVPRTDALAQLGTNGPYAVRSSATAEDLPGTSFAGQHDSYLNVVGPPAVLDHIRSCWASLFTERAVTYRLRNGIDHQQVRMAVVVQQMVDPEASGVVFTADPVTSNRTIATVEATAGLGDALVSGEINADTFRGENALTEADDGSEALSRYMHASVDIGLGALNIIHPLIGEPEWPERRARAESMLDRLVERARSDGAVSREFTASDLALAVIRFCRPLAIGLPAAEEHEIARRHIDTFLAGLEGQVET